MADQTPIPAYARPAERLPSWETVATKLADRLVYHARCDEHPASAPEINDCPFCADRAAFDLWLRKSRAKLRRAVGVDRG